MQTQFTQAITQICDEKNISKDVVIEAVEQALAAAYKKDYGERDQEVRVNLNEESGAIEVYISKTVVEDEVENKNMEISLADAKKVKKDAKIGDVVEILDLPADFGRIAAQTAKQVIVQRIREAERDMVFSVYKDKEGDIVSCTVQRIEGDTIICDLGKASGVLFRNEQIPGERYYPNQRFRVFVVRVEQTAKGPQIVISRSHPGMIKRLFESEVPEITAGTVEIKAIAREAGARTKIAVSSNEEGVDPVGSCVGQRGIRVQAVMNETGGEKVDIIPWSEDTQTFITNALSPAKVMEIKLDEKEQKASVRVPEDQLSLAIGKQGQNVRLAAKLTGWSVDIEGADMAGVEQVEEVQQIKPKKEEKKDLEAAIIQAVEAQNADNADRTETQINADKNVDSADKTQINADGDADKTNQVTEGADKKTAKKSDAKKIEDKTGDDKKKEKVKETSEVPAEAEEAGEQINAETNSASDEASASAKATADKSLDKEVGATQEAEVPKEEQKPENPVEAQDKSTEQEVLDALAEEKKLEPKNPDVENTELKQDKNLGQSDDENNPSKG